MRKMLAALIGAAATVTMITGAGVATASPAHPGSPAHPVTITHPASAHRAVTGTEHFQAVSTSLTSSRSKVVAYGVFNASGVDIATSKFRRGKFRVTHHATHSRQHFSTTTCAGTFRERGTYKLSHGTGKYAGISGHGRYRLRGLIVARHTAHGCSRRPIAIQVIIRAHGPVTLPSRPLQAAEITRQNTVPELAGAMLARLRTPWRPTGIRSCPPNCPQIVRWPAPMRTGNILSLRSGTFPQLADC